MPLAELVLTWSNFTQINRSQATLADALTTHRQMWRNLVNSMIALGWVVRYSCDSVVAGTAGDLVNRWDSNTDVVFATAASGTARSWIVLRDPITDQELLLEARVNDATAAGAGTSMVIVGSPSVHFSGGTTTARPTASDEIVAILGDLATASTSGFGQNNVNRAYAYHVLRADEGVTLIVVCTGNILTGFWYVGLPDEPQTPWSSPMVLWVFAVQDAGGVIQPVTLSNAFALVNSNTNNPKMIANLPFATNGARIQPTSEAMALTLGTINTGRPIGEVVTVAHEGDSEHETPQVGIGCQQSGFRGGGWGRLADVRWVSTGVSTGTAGLDPDNDRVRAAFGPFFVPWDGTSVPLTA